MQSICSLSLGSPQLSSVQFPTSIRLHKCTRTAKEEGPKVHRPHLRFIINDTSTRGLHEAGFHPERQPIIAKCRQNILLAPSSQTLIVNCMSHYSTVLGLRMCRCLATLRENHVAMVLAASGDIFATLVTESSFLLISSAKHFEAPAARGIYLD